MSDVTSVFPRQATSSALDDSLADGPVDIMSRVPRKVAPLDSAGIGRALDVARQDPAQARMIAAALQANPRAVIEQAFRLSPEQRTTIADLPDADLARLSNIIATGLTSSDPSALQWSYNLQAVGGGIDEPPAQLKCEFKAKVDKDGFEVGGSLDTGGGGGKKPPQEEPKKD